jgi:hypothetical protein
MTALSLLNVGSIPALAPALGPKKQERTALNSRDLYEAAVATPGLSFVTSSPRSYMIAYPLLWFVLLKRWLSRAQ